jgi:SAM-dependent methyltransferase
MSDYRENDISYYKNYYSDKGEFAYLGEKQAQTSRMQVFCDWLRDELKPGAKVLDIGCGDAVFAKLMPEFEWYGVDINIEKAKANFSGNYERCFEQDLMKPPYPFEDGAFDAIISSEVLEHLWDLRVVHREAKRLLKRDGLYVISTPNFDWITNHLEHFRRIMQESEKHWTFEHIRHLNYDTHKKFLNECGFVIENHAGADAHYCPIFHNVTTAIQAGLREQGVEIDQYLLHKFIGRGLPHYQHTIILSCRKV